MFEAGFALALGKPVLIIADPGTTVPADLSAQVITRARPDDLDAINFALDHIEQRAPVGTRRPHPQTGRPLGRSRSKELLNRLSHSSTGEWPSINVLIEAIELSGGVAVVNEDRSAGFDLGVWSDDLEAIGGNPMLVELKQTLRPRRGEPGAPRPRCTPDGTSCVDRVSRAGGRRSATAAGRAQCGPISRPDHLAGGSPPTDGIGELRPGRSIGAQQERPRPGPIVTAIDRDQVAKLLADGDSATTTTARGRALEDLVVYLFELVPGVTVTARNTLNAFQAEEIDVAFWNEGVPGGLRMFDHILLVECKNWSAPTGYQELAVFNDKLTSRGRPMGIFVAAVGITGNAAELTAAHGVLARALAQGREIIVLTRREIEALADTDHLVRLLKRKRAQLAVSGTIFEQ